MFKIMVVSSGLRNPSSTRLLADQIKKTLLERARPRELTLSVEVIELREYAHDVTNALLSGFPSERLDAVFTKVRAADALVAVSPIFSGSYSGMFKNFFDALPEGSLRGKPVLLGATAGSARHSLSLEYGLRPLFTYLKAETVRTSTLR